MEQKNGGNTFKYIKNTWVNVLMDFRFYGGFENIVDIEKRWKYKLLIENLYKLSIFVST